MKSDKSELKQRNKKGSTSDETPLIQKDFADLPYHGKVFIARRKKPDSWWMIALQLFLVVLVFSLIYATYYYYDKVHFHVTHFYAHLGYDNAQHHVANKYLHGVGVQRHEETAMKWFKKAADQGHPHAAYNLAIGHLKGFKTELLPGEAKRLIEHAAANGVKEAHHTLYSVCTQGGCEE